MKLSKLIKVKKQIKALRDSRGYWASLRQNPLITLTCAGGCGYTHRVRLSRIKVGEVFICDKKETRSQCRARLPKKGIEFHHQQAGPMCGVTWKKPVMLPRLEPGAKLPLETMVEPVIRPPLRPIAWEEPAQVMQQPEPVSPPRAPGFLSRLLHFLRD